MSHLDDEFEIILPAAMPYQLILCYLCGKNQWLSCSMTKMYRHTFDILSLIDSTDKSISQYIHYRPISWHWPVATHKYNKDVAVQY